MKKQVGGCDTIRQLCNYEQTIVNLKPAGHIAVEGS